MSVFYDTIAPEFAGCVAALGNFDGVHAGHRAVISQTVAFARTLNARPAAAVFSPHPRRVFQPDAPAFSLMNNAQRDRALLASGAEAVFHIRFDKALATMTPEAFIKTVLVDQLKLKGVVTGSDFCFGKDRAGNAETLRTLGEKFGLSATTATQIRHEGGDHKISSSDIRAALRDGRVEDASRLMGRPFAIAGEVTKGDQRGRTIGFPTANVYLGDFIRPALGVYATISTLSDGRRFNGVANLGKRPTVDGKDERLEVHLFDFDGDIYGQVLETELIAFIRAEQKFESFEALKRQIAADSDTARSLLEAR